MSERLRLDRLRVKSIQSRVALNSRRKSDSVSIPAKDYSSIGRGDYIVTVGLGTPKRDLSLLFDTGSDFTWTQCQPCARHCYKQKESIFDPSRSKSYRNVSCSSSKCSAITAQRSCAGSTCTYRSGYIDKSFSEGYMATETLTLTENDVFHEFLFGCGENNHGDFGGTAGLIGLGRSPISLVSQTASKYGRYFSYCLPSLGGIGHLSFGKGKKHMAKAKFTPISKTVFTKTSGSIIDSGTSITRLPRKAYSALRKEFRKQMSRYRLTDSFDDELDTCYNLSSYKSVKVPKISFFLGGNVELKLQERIFALDNTAKVCLAFIGNKFDKYPTIFGSFQQRSLEVIYDVAGGKLGFAAGRC